MAHNDKQVMLGLSIAFPIVAIASVIFRFEARRIKRLKLGADDYTILAALALDLAVTIALLINSRLGNEAGLNATIVESDPVNSRQYVIFSKTTYIFELLVWPCIGLTKISVLLLYKRIFVTPATGRFRILVRSSIWLAVAWTVSMEFASMFSCLPLSSRWDLTKRPSCIDEAAYYTAALATDVITDGKSSYLELACSDANLTVSLLGLILLIPIYKVHKLQMPVKRKLAVIGIFALGALVTITGIIRLHYSVRSFASPPFALSSISHSYYAAVYWSIIESNAGILSACLPTLRPLYEGYRINSFMSTFSSICTRARSRTRSRDKNYVEQTFSGNAAKIPRRRARDSFAMSDGFDVPLQRPESLPCHSSRSSDDCIQGVPVEV